MQKIPPPSEEGDRGLQKFLNGWDDAFQMMSVVPLDKDLVHSIFWRKVKGSKDMKDMWNIYRNIRVGQPECASIRSYKWLRGNIEDYLDEKRRERVEKDRMAMLAGPTHGDRGRSTSRDSNRSIRSHSPGMAGAEKRKPTPPPGCPDGACYGFYSTGT